MGVRRAPLLLAAALLAASAAGPAAADLQSPVPGTVRVRPSQLPSPGITIHGGRGRDGRTGPVVSVPGAQIWDDPEPVVSVPGAQIWDAPEPHASVSTRPGGRAPRTGAPVPRVSIGPGSVCVYGPSGSVEVGDCHVRPSPPPPPPPRSSPRPTPRPTPPSTPPHTPRPVHHPTPRPVRVAPPVRVPVQEVTPTPKPTPTVAMHKRVKQLQAPPRRKNPLGTVLVMVVLVTAIASTTAVAFRAR
ncbi:hypothetical protein AB0C33_11855 [Nonomuraea sp. NPDC048881]|uniref:hypothetical protein n=1 Tax=Nonomuraea sp. NPDC048881 TaxID=3155030 RepID=UPI0033E45B37